MRYSKTLVRVIKEGEEGLNRGLPFTVTKLNNSLGGILKKTYYLILGKSKTGKSSFLYEEFIFNVLDLVSKGTLELEDIEIYLISYEISIEMILAKAAVRWMLTRMKTLSDTKQITGAHGKAHPEIYKLLYSEELKLYLDKLQKILRVLNDGTPDTITTSLNKKFMSICDTDIDEDGGQIYKFKNKNKKVIVGIDHLGLTPKSGGMSLKDTMDTFSAYLFKLKNIFPITVAVVQQVTPTKTDGGQKKIVYGHEDARDTKNTFQDCDVCISIGSPYHEEYRSFTYRGGLYHVRPDESNSYLGLEDRIRVIAVEKDRYGNSGFRTSAGFIGEVGMFVDMEEPEEVNYDKWKGIRKTFKNQGEWQK